MKAWILGHAEVRTGCCLAVDPTVRVLGTGRNCRGWLKMDLAMTVYTQASTRFLLKTDLATFWRKRFVLLAVAEDLSLFEICTCEKKTLSTN